MVDLIKQYDFRDPPSSGNPNNSYWGVRQWQSNATTPYTFNDSTSWIGNSANLVVTTRNSDSGTFKQGWCAGIQGCNPWNICATSTNSEVIKKATNANTSFPLDVIPKVGGVDVSTINIETNMGWFSSSAPSSTGPRYANMLINFWYKHKQNPVALVIDFAMGYFERSGSSWVQRTDVGVGGQYSPNHTNTAGGLTVHHYAYNLNQATNYNTMYFKQTNVKSVINNAFSAFGLNKSDFNWVDVEAGAEIDTNNQSGTGTLKVAIQKCRVSW